MNNELVFLLGGGVKPTQDWWMGPDGGGDTTPIPQQVLGAWSGTTWH